MAESATTKIAVVTGSNKGIGYAIVKGLCEKFNGTVYLTARDETKGKAAVEKLKKLGFDPLFHQLDVTNQKSVDNFKDYVKDTHGGLDVLVNNAGVYHDETAPLSTQAEANVRTNYYGVLRVCEALFPLLRKNARVINVSSSAGHLSRIPSAEIRKKLGDPLLTVSKLNELMDEFVESAKDGGLTDDGWGKRSYTVSKVGVSALTRIQQKDFDENQPEKNVSVNSVHPGYVNTDMTEHRGVLTIEEGAKAPLFLALEPHGLKGQYVWYDTTVVDWLGSPVPSAAASS